jgi:hypothetical protein
MKAYTISGTETNASQANNDIYIFVYSERRTAKIAK